VTDDAPETDLPPLFDVDRGLRDMARARGRRDTLTRGQVQLGDSMAEFIDRHLSPEETEPAGRALMIAASAAGSLVAEGVNRPEVILNIIGFAAARMVTDGRAWTDAGTEDSNG
jgi:hypothetical protein